VRSKQHWRKRRLPAWARGEVVSGGIDANLRSGSPHQIHDEPASRNIGVGVADPACAVLKSTTIGSPENTECFQVILDCGRCNSRQGGALQSAQSAGRQTTDKVPTIHFSFGLAHVVPRVVSAPWPGVVARNQDAVTPAGGNSCERVRRRCSVRKAAHAAFTRLFRIAAK